MDKHLKVGGLVWFATNGRGTHPDNVVPALILLMEVNTSRVSSDGARIKLLLGSGELVEANFYKVDSSRILPHKPIGLERNRGSVSYEEATQ